jgi:peptide/nickel transport system permease protein
MRAADVQLSVPFLVVAIALVSVFGPGIEKMIFILVLFGWVDYCRVVRAEVLSLKTREFVEAARVIGGSHARILLAHILPNVASSVIVVGTLQVARMILAEASLSFLGLGVQPPNPAWGAMVAEGREVITVAWWVSTLPGLAILVTVLGINLVGDWTRDVLDPTLQIT